MELFNFEKETLTRYIEYELKTLSKFKEPLKFVSQTLLKNGQCLKVTDLENFDLNKLVKKEREGKNYHWSIITYNNVSIILRRYRYHFTIFTIVEKERAIKPGKLIGYDEKKVEYGAFTFHTDLDKFGDKHDEMMDKYYNNPFTDLNIIFKNLIRILLEKDSGVHCVWNSVSLPRPKQVDIKLIFTGNSISSVDSFIFCMEELSSIYQEIFAENIIIKRLKQIKEGEKLTENYTAGRVSTETKNKYYHDTGLELVDKHGKKEFHDIYSISRWYMKELFGSIGKPYLYKGEVYLPNGEKPVVGEAAAYKNDEEDGNVIIFGEKYRPECFVPLKKF